MSFTEVSSAKLSVSAVLYLSPSKRRKVSPSVGGTAREQLKNKFDTAEIWRWTLTNDAIASCFIKDIYEMEDDGEGDFYWIGRIPCRTVRLVGIVVGIQVYEKKIIYSIDDGSAVIDCAEKQAPETKPTKKANTAYENSKPASLTEHHSREPKPVVDVGMCVCVVGKVAKWHHSRQIVIHSFESCTSLNAEPRHWLVVTSLHSSHYHLSEPFNIPSTSELQEQPVHPITTAPSLPSPTRTATTASTPSTRASSPIKSPGNPESPPKLRHPSRLHSRDLTDNTFRIYLKHYMDHMPAHTSRSLASVSFHHSQASLTESNVPSTPTKSRASVHVTMLGEAPTPRASSLGEDTPRPSRFPANFIRADPCFSSASQEDHWGFTLSHLRRAPTLVLLARRVIQAEAKRRAREDRQRLPQNSLNSTSQRRSQSKELPPEKVSKLMKKLFSWAIRKLYEEGEIILWDGPSHPTQPPHRLFSNTLDLSARLWREKSRTAETTVPEGDSLFSTSNGTPWGQGSHEDWEDYLSDPAEDEESYITITPAILAPHVEATIRRYTTALAQPGGGPSTSALKMRNPPVPPPGPTPAEMLSSLKREDSRWAKVGAWKIEEALAHMKKEGKVWCIGKQRWELCL